ncbi:trigger factor [Candidatus Uhrbacteria bacterium]|nr:trigger factor [Candidatus Uhrbacteria bacterium]
MMIATTPLPKSSISIDVELGVDELQPYLRKAAEALSREHPMKGFRPGKVPYDMAVQRYGAMAVYEEAADQAVRDAYVRAVREQNLKTVGQPRIEVKTLAPDNPMKFTATVAVLPAVTLPDLTTISVKRRVVHVAPADVDRALEDLRKLQPTEALVDRAAAVTDKVVVDLDLSRDGVPLEGGQARGHAIELTESYYLPKVKEELIGMARGETKTFPLAFPADHYQKHLAGTTVDCSVTVKDVYSVELPPLDDAFAKRLGQADLPALRVLIERNLTAESEKKAADAEEIEMLDAIVDKSKIAELPELLITGEARRMVDELERGVTQQGLTFEEYLKKLKKTRDDVLLGFAPDAVRRVKVALITRAAADANASATAVAPEEIEAEVQQQLKRYQDTPEFHQRMQSEEAREYVSSMLHNRKVIAWLRGQVRWR